MNEDGIFYKGEGFQIFEKTEVDPIIWDDPAIAALSEALIEAPSSEKEYFYTKSFKGRAGYILPSYFLHPDDAFDPSDKTKTELFRIIETYNEDGQGLKEFIKKLIQKDVLAKDDFCILKCNKGGCDGFTIGDNLYCNRCGKKLKDGSRRRLYYLPAVLKGLFYQQGKIIEGVVYHAIKSIVNDDIKIGMNRFLKEEGFEGELDIVIKNQANGKLNGKLLVVHITTSPRKNREWDQFSKTLSHGIKTIFATTGADGSAEKLKLINKAHSDQGTIFWDIANDVDFFNKISTEIRTFLI